MIATDVASPFFAPFKLTAFLALFLAMPYVLFQVWSFVAPGLYEKEKKLAMPLFINGYSIQEAEASAEQMLKRVGLSTRISHKPSQLSGGERQRVAIARALVNAPKCVLLDEPTGNLDKFTASEIQSLLIDLNESFDTSFIMVTHDELMANSMHRKLVLEGGTLHD